MKKNILTYLMIFLAINLVVSIFLKPGQGDTVKNGEIDLSLSKKEFELHELVNVELRNSTDQPITLKNECPEEPLDVFKYKNGEWTQIHATALISCENSSDLVLEPGGKAKVDYPSWNHSLFAETGRYKAKANLLLSDNTIKTIESPEFEVKPQGWFGWIWSTLFFQPLYNVLILLISMVPGKDLGVAIILLTILIRTILLLPSQKALKAQRKMQEIQPKLAQLKEKHKDNQEMLAMETMKIWKEHNVSPLGSCLPMIIQIPILIALFYVIQNGLNPDNAYLLYEPLKNFAFDNIATNFLGILELTKVNIFVLPLIVGGLQFLQMKLAMIRGKKLQQEKPKEKKHPLQKKDSTPAPSGNEMEMANKMMIYIMPIMITLFTASVPAGVGLYWAVSTLYGIAQQLVVNRQSEKETVKVKVLS